jgi:hypothetical protein
VLVLRNCQTTSLLTGHYKCDGKIIYFLCANCLGYD